MKILVGLFLLFSSGFSTVYSQIGTSPVHVLNGTDRDLSSEDLRMFDSLSTSEGVGIGESAHGVKEYMKMQTRLVKYFVEELGFRQVYVESELFLIRPASKYVSDGTGTIKEAVLSIWNPNLQYVELLEWLKDWNQRNPEDKVAFLGADIYEYPHTTYKILKESLIDSSVFVEEKKSIENFCVGTLSQNLEEWTFLSKKIREGTLTITDRDFSSCMSALGVIKESLLKDKIEWMKKLGQDYYKALLAVQVLRASENYMKRSWVEKNVPAHINFRDETLAENILIQKEQHGKDQKFLWIAHTSHTSKATKKAAWWNYKIGEIQGSGDILNSQIRYSSIGMTGYSITGQDRQYELPTSELSFDLKLHNQGHRLVGIHTMSPFFVNQGSGWVQNENSQRHSIDGIFLTPSDHFDYFIYFDHSIASEPLE